MRFAQLSFEPEKSVQGRSSSSLCVPNFNIHAYGMSPRVGDVLDIKRVRFLGQNDRANTVLESLFCYTLTHSDIFLPRPKTQVFL